MKAFVVALLVLAAGPVRSGGPEYSLAPHALAQWRPSPWEKDRRDREREAIARLLARRLVAQAPSKRVEPDPAPPKPAGPYLKLPAEVVLPAGEFGVVRPDTNGDSVKWVRMDPGLALFPSDMLKDPRVAVVMGAPGRYRLLAYTALGGVPSEPATTTVIIGTPPPAPTPVPPGPAPTPGDPLPAAVQAAYALETDPAKANQVKFLAELFAGASEAGGAGLKPGLVFDQRLKGTGDLLAAMHAAADSKLPPGALPKLREAIAVELDKTLAKPADLTDASRKEIADLFRRVAAALGGVK